MAPTSSESTPDRSSQAALTCSDPLVFPPESASEDVHAEWWLHGHPYSKRYKDPRLAGLADLVRYNASVQKGRKAFLYPKSTDPDTPYASITWEEFDDFTESLASAYAILLTEELEDGNRTGKQPTVALLGGGRTLEYLCTQLALVKLGLRVLLLAESNAVIAIHHLLEVCNVLAIFTDTKNNTVDANGIRKLSMIESFPEPCTVKHLIQGFDHGDVWELHTFIIHSSGSTGMPKPIVHTNRSMMLISRMYRLFQDFSIENWFLLFPLYHIAGISTALCGMPSGKINSFPPLSWPPSSSSIFAAWKTLASMGYPVDCLHCAPTTIENMYEYITDHDGDFTPLVNLKILQPGGAALSDRIIEVLVSRSVNVKSTYGSTEIGPVARSLPSRTCPGTYAFRNLYPDSPFIKWEEVGENSYECVVYKGFELAAELWDGKPENEAYRSNDLFVQDPPNSGFFVLKGRLDDMIIHTNGENTSAGPLQLDIQTSSRIINKVLVLGHSRPCTSLLVEVHPEHDPTSQSIRDGVWETVQRVNSQYPKHSQVALIHILSRGQSLPVTPKGNVKRREAEQTYAQDIERLYWQPATLSQSSRSLPDFLRDVLSSLTSIEPSAIQGWTTFYDLGIDSRLALSIRKSLSSYLNQSVSIGVIFENPTISKLVTLFAKSPALKMSIADSIFQTTNCIISKLESDMAGWPRQTIRNQPDSGLETVLLTGASGSLGTALLQELSASKKVVKIYALIRGPHQAEKLRSSFVSRGLDPTVLAVGRKVEVLNFSMKDPLLGLDIETYYKIAKCVTIVVANAWKMDFNLGVEDFVDDCIMNIMNLLRFCCAGRPKTMAFTSSIAACLGNGHKDATVSEEPIGSDPSVAASNGYGQSKYIIERITQTANTQLSIPIVLLRVGQLCGSTKTGHWSNADMWPIMLSTSAHPLVNAFPSLPYELVAWLPVDVAASCITSLILSPRSSYAVHNIVNPSPILWATFFALLQSSVPLFSNMEMIPMTDWTRNLSELADTEEGKVVQGVKLLAFFEEMAAKSDEEVSKKVFETRKTIESCDDLRAVGPVNGEHIAGWARNWMNIGFLGAAAR